VIARLTVCLDFGGAVPRRRVGQFGRDPERRSLAFEWDRAFAAAPLPLWPLRARAYDALLRPNARRGATLPGLFEDSLPDGWGRLLLDREMAARGIGAAEIRDLERLAFVGRHGMGALTCEPDWMRRARGGSPPPTTCPSRQVQGASTPWPSPARGAARAARLAGLKPRRRDAIIDEVDSALDAWPRLAAEHDVPRALTRRIAHEIALARRWA